MIRLVIAGFSIKVQIRFYNQKKAVSKYMETALFLGRSERI